LATFGGEKKKKVFYCVQSFWAHLNTKAKLRELENGVKKAAAGVKGLEPGVELSHHPATMVIMSQNGIVYIKERE